MGLYDNVLNTLPASAAAEQNSVNLMNAMNTSGAAGSVGSAVGTGLSSLGSGLLTGGLSSVIGAGLSGLFNFLSMKRQHKYQMEMVNKQNDLQRSLIQDNALLQKIGLAQAGYSTANPDGTHFSGAPSVPLGASPTDGAYSSLAGLISGGANIAAQIRLANSEAALNETEGKYRAALLEGDIGKLNAEINQINGLLPERINEIKANIANLTSQKQLNEKQASLAAQQVDNLAETLKGIKIDNKWKNVEHEKGVEKLKNEISILAKEGRIKEAEAKLADNGIVLGAGSIGMLVSAALSGQAGHIADLLADSYAQILNGMPDLLSKVLYGLFQGIAAVPKGLVGAVIQSYKDNVPDWVVDFFNKGLFE